MPSRTTGARLTIVVFVTFVVFVGSLTPFVSATDAELDAELTPNRVESNSPWSNATLIVDAPDDAIDVRSPSLDAEELADIFGGDVDGDRVRISLPPDGHVAADFTCIDKGEHTFTVTGVDSGARDTATITVVRVDILDVLLSETVLLAEPSDTVAISVGISRTGCRPAETVQVGVGSFDAGVLLTANLTVEYGAQNAAVLFDLERAGRESPEQYVSVQNATLENVTLHTDPREQPLGPGEYQVNLYHEGDRIDVATLVVEEPTTPPPTPVPTESLPTGTPTEAELSSSSVSPTASGPPTTSSSPGESETENTTTVPGFGVVAAVCGLTAVAWAATRRV